MIEYIGQIRFPAYSGIRCLMMPYIQGDPSSVPREYRAYDGIIASTYIKRGDVGYLTIDESPVQRGAAHRAARAKTARALHTEAGLRDYLPQWGGGGWGSDDNVTLDGDVAVLLANNIDNTCALWDAEHRDTSRDGDIGHAAAQYPYASAAMMAAGEVYKIGIFTPHESLPVNRDARRQFLRIISSGVHGREPYFTPNPLMRRYGQEYAR